MNKIVECEIEKFGNCWNCECLFELKQYKSSHICIAFQSEIINCEQCPACKDFLAKESSKVLEKFALIKSMSADDFKDKWSSSFDRLTFKQLDECSKDYAKDYGIEFIEAKAIMLVILMANEDASRKSIILERDRRIRELKKYVLKQKSKEQV